MKRARGEYYPRELFNHDIYTYIWVLLKELVTYARCTTQCVALFVSNTTKILKRRTRGRDINFVQASVCVAGQELTRPVYKNDEQSNDIVDFDGSVTEWTAKCKLIFTNSKKRSILNWLKCFFFFWDIFQAISSFFSKSKYYKMIRMRYNWHAKTDWSIFNKSQWIVCVVRVLESLDF